VTTDLNTLLSALYVKIDYHLAGRRRICRPPKLVRVLHKRHLDDVALPLNTAPMCAGDLRKEIEKSEEETGKIDQEYAREEYLKVFAYFGDAHTCFGHSALAFTNAHGDLTATFTAGGTSLDGSTAFDPYGQPTAVSGNSYDLGYQGGWTSPTTSYVATASRWYNPASGGFTSQDTVQTIGDPAVTGNSECRPVSSCLGPLGLVSGSHMPDSVTGFAEAGGVVGVSLRGTWSSRWLDPRTRLGGRLSASRGRGVANRSTSR
jgi:RHS repeat-associated protein